MVSEERTYRIGDIKITGLLDGYTPLDPLLADHFLTGVMTAPLGQRQRRFPERVTHDDRWRLHVWAFLIEVGSRRILVDTGLGPASSPSRRWWTGGAGRLLVLLADLGIAVASIDTVILTHLHDDHAGGLIASPGLPAFPYARHLINVADRAWISQSAAQGDPGADEILRGLIHPIQDAGLARSVTGDEQIARGVRLRRMPGHTPGHQVVVIGEGEGQLVISGDLFGHPDQVARPERLSGADEDPARASTSRKLLLEQLAIGSVLAAGHCMEPFGLIAVDAVGNRAWRPADAPIVVPDLEHDPG